MAKIGYARVSSKEQHLDRQLAALKGVDKLFTDKLSGANTNRPELQKMLAYIREGDIVLVTELDRLGRNNHDLTKIMNSIQNKGATLDVLNLPSMTGIADPNLRQLMTNLIRTCLVSFKNYLQEGQYNHLKTAVKGTFTVFPKSPTFV
ncbi:Recombinase (plasmid) [Lactiplantibacillus plantarum subsp. plantarum P-8]|nr:Recombinase [Lactiplantibacillus plantarum subsp. plantarum P-8]KZU89735.1 putative resolvase [Lactiplantibacillus plantarum]MCG0770591.1 Pin-related site-specific recombinase/DNA invertase [Lactiplantibacillus plantarum]MCG0804636.1 Pin-related site-specific recombinase/DNA invertase [Lactiplantibacillus plantarum]